VRQQYERLPDVDSKHNEIHRRCYETPYGLAIFSAAPTAEELQDNVLVYCTADDKLYVKIDGTVKSSAAFS